MEVRAFFNHPLVLERILRAEHLVAGLPEPEKSKGLLMVVSSLANAQMPSDPAGKPPEQEQERDSSTAKGAGSLGGVQVGPFVSAEMALIPILTVRTAARSVTDGAI
jgi:hypothetical protein